MIENLMTVNVDKFIQGTLKKGVPGNYLAVVSSIDEELRLRDLLWEEIQKIAENGDYVIEEINPYVDTSDLSSKMEAKLPEGKTGIALYKELRPDNHYLSPLTTGCVPKNWMVLGVLRCDETSKESEKETKEIWLKLKQPFALKVTL